MLTMVALSPNLSRLNFLFSIIMSKGFIFLIGLVLFCLSFSLGSCSTLHGTADGKSVIVRNDTIKVQYSGSVSKSL